MEIDNLTYQVIGCAYTVHNILGPGFLEKVYENALKLELLKLGIDVRQQGKLPVWYEGHQVGFTIPISGLRSN
jgi:GxxExxY protein